METAEISKYLDQLLQIDTIQDDSLNGLQVANRADVKTVAFAVDVSQKSIHLAKEKGAQFLFVHHGLFWGKPAPIVGHLYERIRWCVERDVALYAAHLPLDLHPQIGNNAQLVKMLGWKRGEDFGEYHGQRIGKAVHLRKPILLQQLIETMRDKLKSEPTVWNFGNPQIKHVAVISGGALSMIDQVARAGMDTLITGEMGHAHYWTAKECKINVLFGGHYLTETVGLKALQAKMNRDLKLDTVFVDCPTGF